MLTDIRALADQFLIAFPNINKDRIPAEEDEAGTSGGSGGGETGTWKTVDDDGRFPSLVDLFLRHGALSKPSRSSSEASRRAPTKRWRIGVPTGSASGLPPIRPNPTSS